LLPIVPCCLLALQLAAEDPAPIGLIRGDLLESDTASVTIRTAKNQVFLFRIDQKTYIERDDTRMYPAELRRGDALEVVADRDPQATVTYARLISVMTARSAPPRRLIENRRAPIQYTFESIVPRGLLTFSGMVLRLHEDRMTLRLKAGGEKLIRLRADTRYRRDGLEVEPPALQTGTRVFVRAGKSLDDELEAYEVVWGQILDPSRVARNP
ncbi:MAG: hypothetical protein ABIZ80_06560, partial [Bryobacteraceae bacterium]